MVRPLIQFNRCAVTCDSIVAMREVVHLLGTAKRSEATIVLANCVEVETGESYENAVAAWVECLLANEKQAAK